MSKTNAFWKNKNGVTVGSKPNSAQRLPHDNEQSAPLTSKEKYLEKHAEELVTASRLKLIEKEHRSIGSILDKRQLCKLEEPKITRRATNRENADIRVASRRSGAAGDELREDAEHAMEELIKKGISLTALQAENFQNEELIWKAKSNDPNYTLKRRYDEPDLQKFRENLNSEQKKIYKEKTRESLFNLAQKYRDEMTVLKEEMDLAAIFHPDANAHRVHCLYLLKLYKGIRADTIEDPVLRMLRDKVLLKERTFKIEEERRELLLRMSNGEKIDIDAIHAIDNQISAGLDNIKVIKKARLDLSIPKVQPLKKREYKPLASRNLTQTLTKSNSLGAGGFDSLKPQVLTSIPPVPPAKLQQIQNKSVTKSTTDIGENGNIDDNDTKGNLISNSMISGNPHTISTQDTNLKIFTKVKRSRLGAGDPRELLVAEAERLDRSDIYTEKKGKEKNSILEDQISNWMIEVMQNNQITKSSEGQSMLPPALSWNDKGGEFTYKETMTSTNMKNPQKLVSFDDFYEMFRKYQNQIDEDENNEISNVNENKQSNLSTSSAHPKGNEDDKSTNHEVNNNRKSMDLSVEFAERNDVDILENLKERDPQFEAYKMMTLRNKPQGRMLIKQSAKLVKTRKMRQVPPLGRLATVLMDSKGKIMKESLKGFRNTFKEMNLNESSGSEDDEDDDILDTDIYDDDQVNTTNETAAELASPYENEKNGNVASEVHFEIPDRKNIKSRSRSRGRSRGKDRKTGVISSDNDNEGGDEPEMQTKLVLAWDSMQVPASHRLGFMKKYSTAIYAVVFTRATDMWSEAAVFALARLEIIKLVKRLKVGSLVYPLQSSSLVENITRCIPPLLASSSTSLIPVEFAEGILVESQNEPLSATALKSIINAILNIFFNICNENTNNEFHLPDDGSPSKNFNNSKSGKNNKINKSNKGTTSSSNRFAFNNSNVTNSSAIDESKAKLCIKEIGFWIDMSLNASLTRAKELLEDSIPFGVLSCKEWIESTSQLLSVDPPPPPVIKEAEKKSNKK